MAVDVVTEVVIDRPAHVVSAYAGDPTNAPEWYVNIESVDWKTPSPLQTGSASRSWPASSGGVSSTRTRWSTSLPVTRMTLRNRGEPAGFSKVAAPLMATAMRRENRKDLAKLKSILEAG